MIGAWWSSEHRPVTAKMFWWDMPRNSVAWSKNSDTSSQLPQAFVPTYMNTHKSIHPYIYIYIYVYAYMHACTHMYEQTNVHM